MTDAMKATTTFQHLIHRTDQVLVMMHTPSAVLARVMEAAGMEAGFVGTGGVVGAYTGMADVGVVTINESVQIAGWIAQSVQMPIMVDGDTGHGGIMAVRRLVADCIKAGVAGIRIDDQPIETKRATQSAGLEVVPLDLAIARYRAAVDMKNELDPDFVVMAQCYTRDAANGGLDELLRRLPAYKEYGGVDWVQFESPHSVDEIRQARASFSGPFSFMRGQLDRYLNLKEHLELGAAIAWYPAFPHRVIEAALWEFLQDFNQRDIAAWEDYERTHQAAPRLRRQQLGEGPRKQRELEERYYSKEMLDRYAQSPGGRTDQL